jgi:hypothetical protein
MRVVSDITGYSRTKRFMVRLALGAIAIYLLITLLFMCLEDRLLYHPVRATDRWIDPPPDCAYENIDLRTDDGTRIHGRWYPHKGAKGAVLYCHSRAGNLSLALLPEAVKEWQREIGDSLFIVDYPGYGHCERGRLLRGGERGV